MMVCWQKFKSFLRGILFPPGVNPSPMLLLTFCLSSFGSSMVLTMPFSFLPRMMKDFGVTENNVGYYVGITASSVYLGQTFSSYFWGWLCDRIGSRKSLLISTALILITTLAFGLSKSVPWAITTRLMQGIVGGIIVSLKAAVYCICDKTNSSLGYSFVFGAYCCGLIAGPAIGGFIVYPVEKFPGMFAKGSLFDKYPLLLPHLVVVSIIVVSYILVYFYIPETLMKRKSFTETSNLLDNTKSNGHIINHDGYTKHQGTRFTVSATTSFMDSESFLLVSMKRSSQTGYDSYLDDHTDEKTLSYFQLPDKTNKKLNCFSSCFTKFKESSFFILMRRRSVVLILSLYGLVSFTNVGFDELFPIFADSSLKFGGLNFTTDQIGTATFIGAIPVAILTFLMPKAESRLGAKRLTLIVFNFLVFVLPLFAYIGALDPSQFWYALLPLLILMRMATAFSFFTVNVLLNNSVEQKYVGTVNGLGMTVSCFFRMVSPVTLGALYSWSLKNEGKMGYPFNHFLPFVLCAVVGLIILFLTSLLPKDDIKLSDLEETENSSDSDSKGSPEHPDQEKA